jgi:hypothetical protein
MAVEEYNCIHCHEPSPTSEWREDGLVCPRCGGADDAPSSFCNEETPHEPTPSDCR